MMPGELQRLYFIIHTFLSYGFDEFIPKTCPTLPLRTQRRILSWMPNRHQDQPLGTRLRLTLQELELVWIEFGQMLSTRRDLFPPHIANQLALLQDRVASSGGKLAQQQIEKVMGSLSVEAWFDDFSIEPLASTSIAQVHAIHLKKNGREVVIRVIRPDILPIIKTDMKLIYRLMRWVPRLLPDGRHLRPQEVVHEYEKTLLDGLNLSRKPANAAQLWRNLEGGPTLYVPEVYPDYCSESMMVMECIYGAPVSGMKTLEVQRANMQLPAEQGVQVFFTQVFRDSFFHADMRPDNIFANCERLEDSQYTGIDRSTVDSLNREDKRHLTESFIAFSNRDYRKMAKLHVDSGWVPPDTNVEGLEFMIRTVYELIFEKPLVEISFGHVLLNLFNTVRRFNMGVRPQFVLLQKVLLYVEGVGRQLYPQLDSWKTARPLLELWIKGQVGIPALVYVLRDRASFWIERMPEMSELVCQSLRQSKRLQTNVDTIVQDMRVRHVCQGQSRYLLGIGAVLLLSDTLPFIYRPEWGVMPGWLMVGGVVTWLIGRRKTH